MAAGLILAAGEGRRFGGPKAPYVFEGERLVDRAVRILGKAGCDPIVVVMGAWVGDVAGARVVINEDWHEGMGSSLRVGLAAVEAIPETDRVLITLVDLPGLTDEAVSRVLDSDARIAQATYEGERGHPVLIGHEHWPEIRESASGDRGARDFLRAHADAVVLIEVGDVAVGDDLDERP